MRVQVRSSQGRCVPGREEVPGVLVIPTVQPDLDLRAEPLVVLDMKALLSPLAQGLPQGGLGHFRVVRGEAESRHDEGVQIRHHVAIAPFQCLLEDDWPAAAQLGELAPELEATRGKKESSHRVQRLLRCNACGKCLEPGRAAQPPASIARSYTPQLPAPQTPRPRCGGDQPAVRSPRPFARAWQTRRSLRPPANET